jgi:hypothetical protein
MHQMWLYFFQLLSDVALCLLQFYGFECYAWQYLHALNVLSNGGDGNIFLIKSLLGVKFSLSISLSLNNPKLGHGRGYRFICHERNCLTR